MKFYRELIEVLSLVATILGALIAVHSQRFDDVVVIVFLIAVFAASVRLIYIKACADIRDALIAATDGCPGREWRLGGLLLSGEKRDYRQRNADRHLWRWRQT